MNPNPREARDRGARSRASRYPRDYPWSDSRVRDAAVVGVVRPSALHSEGTGSECDVLCTPGAADTLPSALVGVLGAATVGPAARRILVGDGLGVLVPHHDGDAVEVARAAGIDVVLAAACPQIGHVWSVREREVAVRRGDTDIRVTVVIVPGTEVSAGGVEAIRVGSGRGHDDVLCVAVGGRRGVAEVSRRLHGLSAKLECRGVAG